MDSETLLQGSTPLCTDISITSKYALDNNAIQAADRFAALSALFDPGTIRHLEDRGVTNGWKCLEVGGGSGTIAAWLSNRVGPDGKVVVTDINTRFLQHLRQANIEVRQHNVITDGLPEATFDLVHARLVLMHLPQREAVLSRLIKALKPGGWLVDEEFDVFSLPLHDNINPNEVDFKASLTRAGQGEVRGNN